MADIGLVIFDCDGVLVDSEIIGIRIETDLLNAAGYAITAERLTERFSGMSWKEILQTIDAETGMGLTDRLADRTEAILDARIPAEVEAIAGVRTVLEGLPYPRCICSNTKRPRVEAVLARTGLKAFFGENVFSAKDLGEGRSKPKPDIFLHGARMMGFAPEKTVVIEDSTHGVEAARAAGMRVIGFTGGAHTYGAHADNLTKAGAHRIVTAMRDLPAALALV